VNEGSPVIVFEAVAEGFHRIVMMNFKPFPSPTVGSAAVVGKLPFNGGQSALERPGKRQIAEVRQPFFDERGAHDAKGFDTFSVGDVLSFEKEKREAEDVVTVHVRDEHGLYVRDGLTCSSQPSKCGGGCVDDMAPIEQSKGMEAAVREEGVSRSEHIDSVRHGSRNRLVFFFSSARPDGFGICSHTNHDIATFCGDFCPRTEVKPWQRIGQQRTPT